MSRRVLVTGGAGFIGSHLTEELVARGDQVTIVDDLSTGRWENISHLEGSDDFRAIIASASDERLLEQEISRHDVVYHLASAVGVRLIIEQPVSTVENIFRSTDIVFGLCARYRRPVLLTSTSEVYGKSTQFPFREDDDVVMGATEKRRWAYACAKALDEFLALAHYFETSLPTFIVRLFNTVGPRQVSQYGMVLPRFVASALNGEPLTVYGDGMQQRCFCSVRDVVQGLIALPEARDAPGMVVNLGSQEEVSILELAKRVIELCDSPSEIKYIPYEEAYGPKFDDMRRRVPDLSRARRLIGWNPVDRLDDIIIQVRDQVRETDDQAK